MTIDEMIIACSEKLTAEETPNTARAYRQALTVFTGFLRSEYGIDPISCPIEKLTIMHFIKYPSYLIRRFRKKTAVVYMAAADYFCKRYLVKNRIMRPDVVDWVDYEDEKRQLHKRSDSFEPRDVAEEDIQAMISAVHQMNEPEPRKARDIAIVMLLSSSGLRNFELCALKVRDLSWSSRHKKPFVHVENGKGDKRRDVPFSLEAWEAVRAYWKERGYAAPDDPVFCRHDKGAGKRFHKPITTATVRNIITFVRDVSGIEAAFTPHYFRHGVATSILRKTGNIKLAQEQLGHASISMTEKYTHLIKDDLVDAHTRTFGS